MNLSINLFAVSSLLILNSALSADFVRGATKTFDLGRDVGLEVVYVPPGKFMMGSTQAEKDWATGIEGGAKPGTARENFEGAPRPMQLR